MVELEYYRGEPQYIKVGLRKIFDLEEALDILHEYENEIELRDENIRNLNEEVDSRINRIVTLEDKVESQRQKICELSDANKYMMNDFKKFKDCPPALQPIVQECLAQLETLNGLTCFNGDMARVEKGALYTVVPTILTIKICLDPLMRELKEILEEMR